MSVKEQYTKNEGLPMYFVVANEYALHLHNKGFSGKEIQDKMSSINDNDYIESTIENKISFNKSNVINNSSYFGSIFFWISLATTIIILCQ